MVELKLHENETEVESGLALTPAYIEKMTYAGQASAVRSMEKYSYSDGYASPSDLTLPERRGRDMNDNWEMVKQFGHKVERMRQGKRLSDSFKDAAEGAASVA